MGEAKRRKKLDPTYGQPKYEVLVCKVSELDPVDRDSYFSPEIDQKVYLVHKNYEPLSTPDGNSFVFSDYIGAKFVADYVNAKQKDSLTSQEWTDLLVVINTTRGKLTTPLEIEAFKLGLLASNLEGVPTVLPFE